MVCHSECDYRTRGRMSTRLTSSRSPLTRSFRASASIAGVAGSAVDDLPFDDADVSWVMEEVRLRATAPSQCPLTNSDGAATDRPLLAQSGHGCRCYIWPGPAGWILSKLRHEGVKRDRHDGCYVDLRTVRNAQRSRRRGDVHFHARRGSVQPGRPSGRSARSARC
jgi:hypothetical protein